MPSQDSTQRFLFDDSDIRGERVLMEQSYRAILEDHAYTDAVKALLGEFICAAALLAGRLKFEGRLILQARSEGEVPVIMAECDHRYHVRAIARDAEQAHSGEFRKMLRGGTIAITIDPDKGQRYQGIVPLDGDNLAECLANYFEQSEQLRTRFWFASGASRCAGMLVQELPASESSDPEAREHSWEHVLHLCNTVSDTEMLDLDHEVLLHRLFHEDPVRVFPPQEVLFQCSCSEQRSLELVRSLGRDEVDDILADEGMVTIKCEFCNFEYQFDRKIIDGLFSEKQNNTH